MKIRNKIDELLARLHHIEEMECPNVTLILYALYLYDS